MDGWIGSRMNLALPVAVCSKASRASECGRGGGCVRVMEHDWSEIAGGDGGAPGEADVRARHRTPGEANERVRHHTPG